MGCNCGKPKCDGHCGVSPAVLQINNPSECVLFHRVEVPASMGDSKTNPPKPGAYKNTLLYYKADGEAFLYSSDGIPTKITGVVSDYACLENKPQINGVTLEGDKSLEDLGIPVVNDATLTITRNGTSVGTFTANSANDTTIDISVPTATSDLTNNSGFITNTVNDLANYYTKTATDGLLDGKQDVLTAGAHIDITGTTISGIVDNANSFTSTNPLENDVISKALWHKDAMTPNGVSGIYIGTGTFQWGSNRSITIGRNAPTTSANPTDKNGTIEIGTTAYATGRDAIAMGSSRNPTQAAGENDIAIGRGNTTAGPGSADTPGANNIAIGRYVDIRGSDNIGVGNLVTSNNRSPSGSTYESKGFGSVAIGSHTFAWMGSVALGSWSSATEEGVVSVGNNYNTPEQAIKRRIIYMADGIADTDAVNVRQLNAAIAGVTPNNISSADWSALWQ